MFDAIDDRIALLYASTTRDDSAIVLWADANLGRIGQICPSKDNPGIGRRRSERQFNKLTEHQTVSGNRTFILHGLLHVRASVSSILLQNS